MNTFAIEFPSVCLRALMGGYQVCAMEYQAGHYSGEQKGGRGSSLSACSMIVVVV